MKKKIIDEFKRFFDNRSVTMKWMMTFMLVIASCIVFVVFGYSYAERSTNNQIKEFNNELMNTRVNLFEEHMSNIVNCMLNISQMEMLEEIAEFDTNLNIWQRDMVRKFTHDIKNVHIGGINTHSRMLYLPQKDCIVSNSTLKSTQEFFKIWEFSGDYSAWKKGILENDASFCYDPINELAYFRFNGYSTDKNRDKAVIIISVEKSELFKEIIGVDESDLVITDGGNRTICSASGKNYDDIIKNLDFSGKIQNIIEGDMAISYRKAIGFDWSYVCITNMEKHAASQTRARWIMTIGIFIGIAAGLVFGYIISKENNKILFGLLKKLNADESSDTKNEYLHIYNTVNNIVSKSRENEIILYNQRKKRLDDVLRSLLHSEESLRRVEDELKGYGLETDLRYVCLAEVNITDCSDIFFDGESTSEESDLQIAKFIISNVFTDVFDTHIKMHPFENGEKRVILLFMSNDKAKGNIRELIEYGHNVIRDDFNIDFKVYISCMDYAFSDIRRCYQDIRKIKEYSLLGDSDIVDVEDIVKNNTLNEYYYYPVELERAFISAIRTGNRDGAQEVINKIFDVNKEVCITLRMVRILIMNIINSVVKNIQIRNNAKEKFFGMFNDFCEELMDANLGDYNMIREKLDNFVDYACENGSRADKESQIVSSEEIKQYIEENYSDLNLNVNQIAMKYSIKQSVLSSMFKKQEGIGLLEYITSVRVEAAKDKIRNTDESLKAIALKTGFASERTFYRVFEKYTGKKPGEYRQ